MAPRPLIPDAGARFLAAQPWVVVGARRADGSVWCSLLTGPPGFLRADGPSLTIVARPRPGDPLAATLDQAVPIGMLGIEPATRRRIRVNGRSRPAVVDGMPSLRVDVDEALSNCPRYIQRREWTSVELPAAPDLVANGHRLTPTQTDWIQAADTLFIATADREGNADASHRGGEPGFVDVVAPDRLQFADFPGNNMFLTLDNIRAAPAAGLLFVDWTGGAVLHVSGQATIRESPRTIELVVEHVVERQRVVALRWSSAAATASRAAMV